MFVTWMVLNQRFENNNKLVTLSNRLLNDKELSDYKQEFRMKTANGTGMDFMRTKKTLYDDCFFCIWNFLMWDMKYIEKSIGCSQKIDANALVSV